LYRAGAVLLPGRTRVSLERRLRGWDEYRQMMASTHIVISYGKSGRTWLRAMLSTFFRRRFDLQIDELIRVDNYRRLDGRVPAVFFTHDEYINYYLERDRHLKILGGKKVLYLVRDPRDVSVSMYFHCLNRMKDSNKPVNQFRSFRKDMPISAFVQDEVMGLPAAIAFTERIVRDAQKLPGSIVIRYEDLRANPGAGLQSIIRFLGFEPTGAEIDECIEMSSMERMQKAEREAGESRSGKVNTDSLKSRRGVVGGFVDYFSPAEQAAMNALVRNSGLGGLGYGSEPPAPRAPSKA
jgi:alcohol sulfotransferase